MGNMARRPIEDRARPVADVLRRSMPPMYDAWTKLEKAVSMWGSLVGQPLGKQSAIIDFARGELVVVAETPLVASRLAMMKGNIARALAERWGLDVVKVKVVVGRLPLKSAVSSGASRPAAVSVREEDVREFESHCLESLPDFPQDAAESLARLRAFFIKRFKQY
jgi:hypothetical protein